MSALVDLGDLSGTSDVVSDDMFGGNYLFTRQNLDNFKEIAHETNLTGVRYPGGGITEKYFDIKHPDQVPDNLDATGQAHFTGLSDFLSGCNELKLDPTIVIPTKHALDESGNIDSDYLNDVRDFVASLLDRCGEGREFESINISAFEIGNEYWGSGEMTAAEYGAVADALSVEIQDTIDGYYSGSEEPDIITQMGNPVRNGPDFQPGGVFYGLEPGSEAAQKLGLTANDFAANGDLKWSAKLDVVNQQIIDQLSPEAREAIDGLVEHYYYVQPESMDPDLDFTPDTTAYITQAYDVWEDNGLDLDLHITEWNVHDSNYSQLGQVGAGALIAQFSHMIEMGVDSADIWPLQHNTSNDLAGTFNREPSFTPLGAAFDIMSETIVGYELLSNTENVDGLEVISYGKGDSFQQFLVSRSVDTQDLMVDLSAEGQDVGTVTVTRIYFESNGRHWVPDGGFVDVEGYLDHDAVAKVTTEQIQANDRGEIEIALRPYEVVLLSYEQHELADLAEIVGTEGDDYLEGTDLVDLIKGMNGDDTLKGGAGHDSIYGGQGNDKLVGNSGDDLLDGGDGDNRIWGGVGNDTIVAGSGADLIGGGLGDDSITSGAGNDVIWGSNGNDSIFGGHGNDSIFGGHGNDVLYGGEGDDLLNGGDGANRIFGDQGNDTILAGSGDDYIGAGVGSNWVASGAGNDTIWSHDGADEIHAGAGDDQIGAGADDDRIFGEGGNDTLWGDIGDDLLDGSDGNDLLNGGDGNDDLSGGNGNDTLWGAAGTDTLSGGGGDDCLHGGNGNDTLMFESGNDTLIGGNGSDVFSIASDASGAAQIRDFDVDQGDILRISKDLLSADLQDKSISEILESIAMLNENGDLVLDFGDKELDIYLEGIDNGSELEDNLLFV